MTERKDYYVYMYFRVDGTPLYVGKGRGQRWRQHTASAANTNAHFRRIIAKYGSDLPSLRVREHLSDAQAKEIERALIAAIGREDKGVGPLVNMTDGGDGKVGYVAPPETREKLGLAHKGRKHTPEARAAMSAYRKGRKLGPRREGFVSPTKGTTMSAESCAKMSAAKKLQSAEISARVKAFHDSMTPEQKIARAALISEATKAAMTPDVCAQISVKRTGVSTPPNKGRTGQPNSPELRAKISEAWARKYAAGYVRPRHTEETKVKMSASQQRNAAIKRASKTGVA